MVELVDSLDLTTNVELLDFLVQGLDGGVIGVTAEDELSLLGSRSGAKDTTSAQTHKRKLRAAQWVRKSSRHHTSSIESGVVKLTTREKKINKSKSSSESTTKMIVSQE